MSALFREVNYGIEQNLGRPRTLLVVGADAGQTGAAARQRGAKLSCLETLATAAARTRELADDAHLVTNLDSDEAFAPLKGKRFDLIVLDETMPDVTDAARFFRRVVERLEPEGHLIVTIPQGVESIREAVEGAGLQIMRVDVNPWILRAAATKLGWYDSPQHAIDLKTTHTMSGRFTYGHVVRPLERLLALQGPAALAQEHIVMARLPPKPGKLTLTVGMLTLNEEESIARMIDDIRAVVPDAKILVVDSSSDRTPDIAREKGARVVRQLPPRGHGPAMERLMYEAAGQSDALVYLDCDFTYPTETLPRLRELLESGVDVVNASRTARYPKAMPVPNFLANRVFAGVAQLVHGLPTTDVHSGMRGYRSSVIRAFAFDGEGDALPLDTLILPARANYNVVEFPIDYNERVGVSKLAKMRGTVWTFIRIAGAVGYGKRVRAGGRFRLLDRDAG